MSKLKHKVGDTVVIYKDTPTYKDGALGKVIDFSSEDKSYLIGTLEDVLRFNGDMERLLDSGKWVTETNLELITFQRRTLKTAILDVIGAFLRLFKRG
jgi:hypothetical protein